MISFTIQRACRISRRFFGLSLLLLLTLPAEVQAQFTFTTNNGAITITKYNGYERAVTIPSTINGLPVTSIGDMAFYLCTGLTSVTIPDSVTSIGYGAFYQCVGLPSITLPDSLTIIGDSAFSVCLDLTSVTIPNGVTNIGIGAFSDCHSLAFVKLGNSITTIGKAAFWNCSLTKITIPDSVTSIGDSAFFDCINMTGVYFRGNAPSIGASVFADDNHATVYFLPGTAGWGSVTWFGGIPAVLWNPQVQTNGASFGVRTNRFGFTITGASNLVVVVESCTNLTNPTWSPVETKSLTGGSSYFSDPQWTNYPARFYRLRSP